MRVLLDTNVILDAMLQRAPWHIEADAVMKAAASGHIACAVTTHTLATSFYVGRKTLGTQAARAGVRQYLGAFAILPIDKQTLLDADASPGIDFEDNILMAAAITATMDVIITRNAAHFAPSLIPVWEPAELLRQLAAAGPKPGSGAGP
jgi:predicted nucleic acid-binding protein